MIDIYNLKENGVEVLPDLEHNDIKIVDEISLKIAVTKLYQQVLLYYLKVKIDMLWDCRTIINDEEYCEYLFGGFPVFFEKRYNVKQFLDFVQEIYDAIFDNRINTNLRPILEYILYEYVEEMSLFYRDSNQTFLGDEDDYLTRLIGKDKEKECIKQLYYEIKNYCTGKDALEDYYTRCCDLVNCEYVFEILFDDMDFLPSNIKDAVQLYISEGGNPEQYETILGIGLDAYTELMDDELLKQYKNLQEKIAEVSYNSVKYEEDLLKAIEKLQSDKSRWECSEDEMNDFIRDLLTMAKYSVCDQSRYGQSYTGENAGHPDFIIKEDLSTKVVCEALKLKSVNKTAIESHLYKLINQYNPTGCKNLYLLGYVVGCNMESFFVKFRNYLNEDLAKKYHIAFSESYMDTTHIKKYKGSMFKNGVYVNITIIMAYIGNESMYRE